MRTWEKALRCIATLRGRLTDGVKRIEKRRNSAAAMTMAAVILCCLLPVTAQAGANDHASTVKVAGTELTETGYYAISALGTKLDSAPASPDAKGYVHWDSSTGTLTLHNAEIDGGSSDGISANQNFTVVLPAGTTSSVTSGTENALTCNGGSITIKGPGKLTATGKKNGIKADYTVAISDGAEVDVTGESERGIYLSYRLSYYDGVRIESSAGAVTITGKTYGIGYTNTSSIVPFEIKGTDVTIKGETAVFNHNPDTGCLTLKASSSLDGTNPETYDSTKLSSYKWFKTSAPSSGSHNFTKREQKPEALKTEGSCRDGAVYYYSCSACGVIEKDDTHTFTGGKNPDNHVGGTYAANASDPDHNTQTPGYTGDTKCSGCGSTLASGQQIQPDPHVPSNDWSYDDVQYWKACTVNGCDAMLDPASHVDGDKDGKCDDCAHAVPLPPVLPKTGDDSMMWLWLALLSVSGVGVVIASRLGKKGFSVK